MARLGLAWLGLLAFACGNGEPAGAPASPAPLMPAGRGSSPAAPHADAAAAIARSPHPDAAPAHAPADLVDIATVDPTIALEMRYATVDNFTGVAVYPVARCKLRYAVAIALAKVQAALREQGYGLKLWDCYRPISVQQKFWDLVPDGRYVARPVVREGKPVSGSKHNRGAAVDLTLVDASGKQLEMPTDHDDFSEKAHRGYKGASEAARTNSDRLEKAMEAEGFEPLSTEWWHFDADGWRSYPLSDEPL